MNKFSFYVLDLLMLNKEQIVEVSDTTGDAMKNKCRLHNPLQRAANIS